MFLMMNIPSSMYPCLCCYQDPVASDISWCPIQFTLSLPTREVRTSCCIFRGDDSLNTGRPSAPYFPGSLLTRLLVSYLGALVKE